ncbi:hypothetical protein VPH35_130321 [Triticum aestivum]
MSPRLRSCRLPTQLLRLVLLLFWIGGSLLILPTAAGHVEDNPPPSYRVGISYHPSDPKIDESGNLSPASLPEPIRPNPLGSPRHPLPWHRGHKH